MLPFSFFKAKPKNPQELVRHLRDAQVRLDSSEVKTVEKANEDCSRCLSALRNISNGDISKVKLVPIHHFT